MINRLKIFIPILIAVILFTSYKSINDVDDKNKVLLRLIMQSLNQGHFESKSIDDDFSDKVFTHFLGQVDANKKFLTSADIEKLEAYHYRLDNQINDANYEFFELTEKIIRWRIEKVGDYYKDILAHPFDFNKDEFIEFDIDKLTYANSEQESKLVWHKYLKYRALLRYSSLLKEQKSKLKKDASYKIKTDAALEIEARKGVLKSHDEWYKRMLKIDDSDWLSVYLNSITTIFDPHTSYFPPKDKENFDIAMSGRLEGIGATLVSKDGYITIYEIVPGSACWRQGELAVDDKILKVAQGDAEPLDIVDMRVDHAVKFIRGKKGTEVRLTVQKLDGQIQVISIIRDIVVLEETYAKSAIFDGVGYIYLPKFYADFNGTGGNDCSEDVKNEVIKLKAEGVTGIILDLRNNGGGSLQDVVEMSGLFIKEGPIVQVKAKVGAPRILADTDKEVVYDGPLVVMVNEFSASASEILAAAMQDYGRAVIVGSSPTTYGKGTVQRAFDLDGFISEAYADVKPLGALKLTLQKFYRINGGATQLKGVIPDVILPDTRSYLKYGEKEQDFPIAWDEIDPLRYDLWENKITNFEEIRSNSEERVHDSKVFQMIEQEAKEYKSRQDDTQFSLNYEMYAEELKALDKQSKKYNEILKETNHLLSPSFLKVDMMAINSDTLKAEKMNRWKNKLMKDVYIDEAIHVLKDIN